MNTVVVSGRLVSDSDFSFSDKGIERGIFTIVDNSFSEVQFLKCNTFDKKCIEKLKKYGNKGNLLNVSGKLQIKKFEDKYYTSINVRDLSLLSKKFVPDNSFSEEDGNSSDEIPF